VSPFFDTNILVYAQQTDEKGIRARALFAGGGKLSVQVLNEFTAVSRRKQGKNWREISEAISDALALVDPLRLRWSIRRWRSPLTCTQPRGRSPKITGSPSTMR